MVTFIIAIAVFILILVVYDTKYLVLIELFVRIIALIIVIAIGGFMLSLKLGL